MDIGFKAGYPASALSNFAPHPFVFDGVECASMEGLLQAFKSDDPQAQVEVCKLTGFAAKRRGKERNADWKRVQKLWWQGQEYDRHGKAYQILLDRAFNALAQNEVFRKALLDTGDSPLTHSIGNPEETNTVLTEREFCSRLETIRTRLRSGAL